MKDVLELVESREDAGGEGKRLSLGIRICIGEHAVTCPLTSPCSSSAEMEAEIAAFTRALKDLGGRAKAVYQEAEIGGELGIREEMDGAAVWEVLSRIPEEGRFTEAFNCLEENRRRGIAEHVLTSCNVFSGKASVFSARYSDESALLE